MKLATMSSACPEWSLEQIIEGMKAYGYQGFEPRIGWNHAMGIEVGMSWKERERVRSQVEDAGLEICCIATGARLATEDQGQLAGYVKEVEDAIDLAADLGAPYVRTFGGERGTGEFHFILKRVVEVYKRLMDRAQQRGVTVLMETHDAWCVSAQVRAVVEGVQHDNMAALWDILHPYRYKERAAETMANLGAIARHLHGHDAIFDEEAGKMNVVTLGDGVIDYVTPVRMLLEAAYDGYFSIEFINRIGQPHDAEATLRDNAQGFREMLAKARA